MKLGVPRCSLGRLNSRYGVTRLRLRRDSLCGSVAQEPLLDATSWRATCLALGPRELAGLAWALATLRRSSPFVCGGAVRLTWSFRVDPECQVRRRVVRCSGSRHRAGKHTVPGAGRGQRGVGLCRCCCSRR